MEEIARCATGIKALDELLSGGLPAGDLLLLAGASGTGKTVMSTEFLFRGAKEFGEKGLYLSLCEGEERMKRHLGSFSFYDADLIDTGMVVIDEVDHDAWLTGLQPQTYLEVLNHVKSIIEESGAKRVVVDSITSIANNVKDEGKIRELIFRLGFQAANLGCTLVLISEIPPQAVAYSAFGVEEFIADGIILLNEFERNGELVRTLQIIKMRGIQHSRQRQIMQITSKGLQLMPMFKSGI